MLRLVQAQVYAHNANLIPPALVRRVLPALLGLYRRGLLAFGRQLGHTSGTLSTPPPLPPPPAALFELHPVYLAAAALASLHLVLLGLSPLTGCSPPPAPGSLRALRPETIDLPPFQRRPAGALRGATWTSSAGQSIGGAPGTTPSSGAAASPMRRGLAGVLATPAIPIGSPLAFGVSTGVGDGSWAAEQPTGEGRCDVDGGDGVVASGDPNSERADVGATAESPASRHHHRHHHHQHRRSRQDVTDGSESEEGLVGPRCASPLHHTSRSVDCARSPYSFRPASSSYPPLSPCRTVACSESSGRAAWP